MQMNKQTHKNSLNYKNALSTFVRDCKSGLNLV